MKSKIIYNLIFSISTLLLSCTTPLQDNEQICKEFYRLNRNCSFNILFEVNMGDRISIKYDNNDLIHYTFNGLRVRQVFCAIFDSLASSSQQKKIYQMKLSTDAKKMLVKYYRCKQSNKDTFQIYKKLVAQFYQEYNQIKMPIQTHRYNTLVFTNSGFGRYVQFLLDVKSNKGKYSGLYVYYIPSDEILNKKYWDTQINRANESANTELLSQLMMKKRFWDINATKLKKIASNWYYMENATINDGQPN